MKQVLVKDGSVVVQEVPTPTAGRRNILVKVLHSCVSVGTEIAGVRMSGLPLYKRALRQPDNVRKVLDMVKDQGLGRTIDRVRGKLASGTPTGYSASGVIVGIGEDVEGFTVGEVVACAGAGIANHAAYIDVPINLAVKLPVGLSTERACTVTLGAIALQGVRRCEPTLGETIVLIGLGLLGQLTAQMLKANGCRVIGVDPNPSRVNLALTLGMDHGLDPNAEDYVSQVLRLTGGMGADAAIITAATSSDEVVSQSFKSCRRKGRVVLVGDVGLNLNRSDFYSKEIDFRISTSYGPGRYDPVYEEGGQDYPLAYVRWTENRNMSAYLEMLADGRIRIDLLAGDSFSISEAPQAYDALKNGSHTKLVVTLAYEQDDIGERTIKMPDVKQGKPGRIKVALAGAGGFAQGMHLPNMIKLREQYELRAVLSRTGANALSVAQQYQAAYASTDYDAVLSDPEIDLVLIATRHDLHADMALRALKAGKHVLLEKPMALNERELDNYENFYSNVGEKAPILMTGFNRRFSPALVEARKLLDKRTTPLIVNYRMNAGFIPRDHWVHGPEGGGRNIGEGCHIYDVFQSLTGARPINVQAATIHTLGKQWGNNDNFIATISYDDGSVCSLTYTAMGDKSFPKEQMEIFVDGKVLSLDDYRELSVSGMKRGGWSSKTVQKGQFEELVALADGIRDLQWPISLQDQIDVARVSLKIEAIIEGTEG